MHFFKNIILSLVFIVSSLFANNGLELTKEESDWLKNNPNIKLLTINNQEPLFFEDSLGRPKGVIHDLYKEVNRIINYKIELVLPKESGHLHHQTQSNKGLYGAAVAIDTPQTRKLYNFTDTLMEVSSYIITTSDKVVDFRTTDSIRGKKIATPLGHAAVKNYLLKHGAIPVEIDTPLEQMKLVLSGEVDALIGYSTYLYLMNKYLMTELEVAFIANPKLRARIAINKEYPLLHSILSKAVSAIDYRTATSIVEKWADISKIKQKQTEVELSVKEKEWLKNNPKITMAVPISYPRSYYGEDGEFKGLTVDYIRLLERNLGVEFELVIDHWKSILEKTMDHKIDIISNAAETKERKKRLEFTNPYYRTPRVFVSSEGVANISDIKELCGQTIAVHAGSDKAEFLKKNYPCIKVLEVTDKLEELEAVITGKAYGAYDNYDFIMGSIISKALSGLKIIYTKELALSDAAHLGIRNDKPLLTSIIRKGVDSIGEEERNKIVSKWLGITSPSDSKTLSEKEFDYLKRKGKIDLCVRTDIYPLDGLLGKETGIFGEYYEIISKEFGIEFNFIPTNSLKEAKEYIEQKKCDMLSGLPTKQRYIKNVAATEPFYETYAVVVSNIEKRFIRDVEFGESDKLVVYENLYKNYLKTFYPEAKNVEVEKSFDRVMEKVLSDKEYSTILINEIADRFIDEYGYKKLKISGYFSEEKSVKISMWVHKEEQVLLNIMNKAISAIPKERIKEIQKKYQYTRYHETIDYSLLWWIIGISLFFIFLAVFRMVTLRRDNRKLHELINSAMEGIGIFKDGRFIDGNEQVVKMMGYDSLDEMRGLNIFAFVDKDNHELVKEALKRSKEPYEILALRKDRTTFPAMVKGTILGDGRRISTIVDITGLKNIQDELEYLNKTLEERIQNEIDKNKTQQAMLLQQSRLAQMGEMISMIAHQWRQPINNVYSMIQTIALKHKKGKLDEKLMGEFKSSATKQIYFMSNTIDDFKNFFKPQKEKEKFLVCEAIDNSVGLFKPIIDKTGIEFNVYCEKGIELYGFPNEMGQVILNLLNNAKDALLQNNKDNKWIDLSISRDGDNVFITIYDNAGGIHTDIIERVFDPYFSTKTDKNGTGLGLYMSKIIIEEHMDGELSIENKQSGLYVCISLIINKK